MDPDIGNKYQNLHVQQNGQEDLDIVNLNDDSCCNHLTTVFDHNSSEEVCQDCGTVLTDEPGFYENDDHFDRMLLSEREISNTYNDFTVRGILSSKINNRNLDHLGQHVKDPAQMNRLRNIDKLISVRSERSLRKAMFLINFCCEKLQLPDFIKNRASDIYKKGHRMGVIKGRSIKSCVIASITLACNEHDIYRNTKEMINVVDELDTNKFRSDIFVSQRRFVENMDLKKTVLEPDDKLPFISSRVGISRCSEVLGLDIYYKLKKFDIKLFIGRSPSAIAACVLYIATKYNREYVDQEQLTTAGDISKVTLRKRCYEFVEALKRMGEPLPAYFTEDDGDDKEYKLFCNGDLSINVGFKQRIVKAERRGRRRKVIK
jgi:transcription initiation factor TFIIIB Brf1 subunit/transcription initiation factor TFIIB